MFTKNAIEGIKHEAAQLGWRVEPCGRYPRSIDLYLDDSHELTLHVNAAKRYYTDPVTSEESADFVAVVNHRTNRDSTVALHGAHALTPIRTSLRRRLVERRAERAAEVARRLASDEFDRREAAGLARIGDLPDDVQAEKRRATGGWHVNYRPDVDLTLEQAERVVWALRLVLGRDARLWREGRSLAESAQKLRGMLEWMHQLTFCNDNRKPMEATPCA